MISFIVEFSFLLSNTRYDIKTLSSIPISILSFIVCDSSSSDGISSVKEQLNHLYLYLYLIPVYYFYFPKSKNVFYYFIYM
jgi:hypothetical protein